MRASPPHLSLQTQSVFLDKAGGQFADIHQRYGPRRTMACLKIHLASLAG